jgi:hypothetical protein
MPDGASCRNCTTTRSGSRTSSGRPFGPSQGSSSFCFSASSTTCTLATSGIAFTASRMSASRRSRSLAVVEAFGGI